MSYEFNEEENAVFTGLVNQAFLLGILILSCGGIYLLLSLAHFRLAQGSGASNLPILVSAIAAVASSVAFSAYLLDAARQFKKVVDTEGQDIDHVLAGLVSFSSMFRGGAVVLWVLVIVVSGLLAWFTLTGGSEVPSV